MSVWDDFTREPERPRSPGDARPRSTATTSTAVAPGDAHDDVRTAAQKDAAEIVARARLDIRRVVTDAQRDLMELSAQVHAADVDLPESALPDPFVLEAEEVAAHGGDVWRAHSPETEMPRLDMVVSRAPEPTPLAFESYSATPLTSPKSAKAFVALFTLAGLFVVAGTAWWLQRAPGAPANIVASDAVESTTPAPTSPAVTSDAAPGTTAVDAASGLAAPPDPFGVGFSTTESPVGPAPPPVQTPAPVQAVPVQRAPAPTASAAPAASAPVVTPVLPAPRPALASPTPPPSAPPAVAVAPVAPAPSTPVPAPSPERQATLPARVDLSAAGRQWFDAYHRQDKASMAAVDAPSLSISDERRPEQRFPFGLEVSRAFEDEQLQLAGDSATFSARMTERAATGALVSHVSQTWVRRLGEWKLQQARIAFESQLPATAR